jgi:hypothetical protein
MLIRSIMGISHYNGGVISRQSGGVFQTKAAVDFMARRLRREA